MAAMPQLRLRSTFIDFEDAATDGARRRARSLPPPRAAPEAFADDAAYVATLSERLGAFWAAPRPAANTPKAPGAPAPARQRAEASAAAGGGPASEGSYGHPQLCSRPCLYFASGQCANGSSCDFCHHVHTKRPAHLEKKHREALQAMPTSRVKALIFPVLQEKVTDFDGSLATALAFEELARACGQDGAAPLQGKLPRIERGILQALHAASLRVAIVTLQRMALTDEPVALAVSEAFLQRLRRNAAAH